MLVGFFITMARWTVSVNFFYLIFFALFVEWLTCAFYLAFGTGPHRLGWSFSRVSQEAPFDAARVRAEGQVGGGGQPFGDERKGKDVEELHAHRPARHCTRKMKSRLDTSVPVHYRTILCVQLPPP